MKYFECTVSYESREQDNKKVSEVFLTAGETFGDAEDSITTRVAEELSVSPEVTSEKTVRYNGILEAGCGSEIWYNVKAQWTNINEKGKEVKCKENYLVPAPDTNQALRKILAHLEGTMLDYEILSITKTKIRGVHI